MSLTRPRVAVTGAGGFIGRHVVHELLEAGYPVEAVVGSRDPFRDTDRSRLDVRRVDLLDEASRDAWIRGSSRDAVIHTAWYAEPGKYWTSEENERWAAASGPMFERLAEQGCRRVIALGTCAEYEVGDAPLHETRTPIRPNTPYGKAKQRAHEALDRVAEERGLSASWARIFFPFGPGEPEVRFVPAVVRALLAGQSPKLSHGRQVRDFLYAGEIAAALRALMESDVRGAVNVASGEPVTLRDLAEAIAARFALPRPELAFGAVDAPAGEAARVVADVRRLRDEVGFRPRGALEAALDATIAWWRGG